MARARADLVHAHAGKAAALMAALRSPVPVVGTVHALKKDLSAYRRFAAVIGVSGGVLAACGHGRKTVIHNGVRRSPATIARDQLRRRFGIAADARVTSQASARTPRRRRAAVTAPPVTSEIARSDDHPPISTPTCPKTCPESCAARVTPALR